MNHFERIEQLQVAVDEFVSDGPLPDLILPSSMTDSLYSPRNIAEYGVGSVTSKNTSIATTQKAKPKIEVQLVKGSSVKMRPVTWLIDQWLPMGKLTLLAGAGGTGKTTLALGIAAAITSGGIFPNGQRYSGTSNVLIWSSEDDPEDILIPRLAAMEANLDKVLILKNTKENDRDRTFNPASDLESLKIALDKVGGAALILLDPVIGIVKGNSDKATDVREGLDPLVEFAQDQHCAIIGISHFGKGGQGKDPAERVLGSQAFTALPRMVWATVIDKETGDRVLVRAKTNLSARDGGFLYSVEQTQYNGIDTTIVAWKGPVEGSSHQIIFDAETIETEDEDHQEKESAKDFAKRFLLDILGGKDAPTKTLKAEAKDAGVSWRTIERVSAILGIKKYNSPLQGCWVWSLKNSSEQEAVKLIYGTPPSDAKNFANSLVLGEVGGVGGVPAQQGSQVHKTIANGEVCQASKHKEFGEVLPDFGRYLGGNPGNGGTISTKQYLDESWDGYIAKRDDQDPPFQRAQI